MTKRMKNAWILALTAVIAASCQVNKSFSTNPSIGLSTKGNGLSCDDVTLTNADGNVNSNEFVYGEKLEIHFNNMEGFTLRGKEAFPGMSLTVVSDKGDTILHNKDVYKDYPDKIDMSPLALTAYFTAANPLHSKKSYRLLIHIWDKKGKGTFDATLSFSIKPNPVLKHQTGKIKYDEIYLFDRAADRSITNDKIRPEQEIFVIFEGLKGFPAVNGKSDIVIAMTAKDDLGRLILDEKDLTNGIPLDETTVKGQIAPNVVFHAGQFKNPIKLDVRIYDRSHPQTTYVITTATLQMEQ
jgi:hypothetical protein